MPKIAHATSDSLVSNAVAQAVKGVYQSVLCPLTLQEL
ncbi:MAG: hypothetical protein QCH31_03665 [Methanolobus sp.]|nr:hypothetical protein [Methanolobus sp.]